MFDSSTELRTYYDTHVRLGTPLRNDLAGYRDLNLQRLRDGLVVLGNNRGETYRSYVDSKNQGSYAMHTLNQCDEYDIDVAVIWDKADLPEDAKAARERVRDALLEKCQQFLKEPTARGNAVTVWYSEGYHIDFAIYRRTVDSNGNVLTVEHAGSEGWASRQPLAFSDWFASQVTTKSPPTTLDGLVGATVTVPPGQLRRVARFAKAFAKSRSGWSMPGGVVITALVCESFVRDGSRDDVALVKTLRSMHGRLRGSVDVPSPIAAGSLTGTEKRKKEVERFRDRLGEKLASLDILERQDCTHKQAMKAWNDFFCHEFWAEEAQASKRAMDASAFGQLQIDCWLAKSEGGRVYRQYQSDSSTLPKRVQLRFTANPIGLAGPYMLRWTVRNEGDEATDANTVTWDKLKEAGEPLWTSTAYKGKHTMTCEVLQGGSVVRRGVFVVRIGWR